MTDEPGLVGDCSLIDGVFHVVKPFVLYNVEMRKTRVKVHKVAL